MSVSPDSKLTQAILTALEDLVKVVAQLRSPEGGCPWDRQQTPESLIPYVIEEAYEVVAAIQSGDQKAIIEELGDLLLQVVLQAQIAQDEAQFTLAEVAQGISEKLIRRHPHVFGDLPVEDLEQIHRNWEAIKAAEKGQSPDNPPPLSEKLATYPRKLPPLLATLKLSQKAAAAGLEWDCIEDVWAKFHEELEEFQAALTTDNKAHQEAELGDLLFTLVNLARWYDLDPSQAIQGTNHRFIQRLEKMEESVSGSLTDYSVEELDQMWQQAKAQLGH
ncbi:nucleoside triphosphate pyrophosphohydrolase [Spirulina subsalsa]|uniref:nucleoside triphosphate pyrophosphohydrolase n=1 Tax=Spirulina subsalsa TaxID=54311 RepID=UPI0002F9BE68|nr:nucleoside triphosphate pyrophosphohydrolase [Spirulina subsalsa]